MHPWLDPPPTPNSLSRPQIYANGERSEQRDSRVSQPFDGAGTRPLWICPSRAL